jgi:hypothetical protein
MREWIHHHLLEGVDKLLLIDHNSYDDYLKKNKWLHDLIKAGRVEFVKSKSDNQVLDYSFFIDHIKRFDWVCLIDMDEFIFTPRIGKTLKDVLNKEYNDYDYIRIPWKMFTHSDELQPKSVIENNIFTHDLEIDPTSPSKGLKCIGKTRFLVELSIHSMNFAKNVRCIELKSCHNEYIQNNHYRTQSNEYLYGVKEIRGGGVHKEKYRGFSNHKRPIYTKHCDVLKNKRRLLINELLDVEQVKPVIHESSSFYLHR